MSLETLKNATNGERDQTRHQMHHKMRIVRWKKQMRIYD